MESAVSASDWKKLMFAETDLGPVCHHWVKLEQCLSSCLFSPRPCTVYAYDGVGMCYHGHRDSLNEISIAATQDLDIYESKGQCVREDAL